MKNTLEAVANPAPIHGNNIASDQLSHWIIQRNCRWRKALSLIKSIRPGNLIPKTDILETQWTAKCFSTFCFTLNFAHLKAIMVWLSFIYNEVIKFNYNHTFSTIIWFFFQLSFLLSAFFWHFRLLFIFNTILQRIVSILIWLHHFKSFFDPQELDVILLSLVLFPILECIPFYPVYLYLSSSIALLYKKVLSRLLFHATKVMESFKQQSQVEWHNYGFNPFGLQLYLILFCFKLVPEQIVNRLLLFRQIVDFSKDTNINKPIHSE